MASSTGITRGRAATSKLPVNFGLAERPSLSTVSCSRLMEGMGFMAAFRIISPPFFYKK